MIKILKHTDKKGEKFYLHIDPNKIESIEDIPVNLEFRPHEVESIITTVSGTRHYIRFTPNTVIDILKENLDADGNDTVPF